MLEMCVAISRMRDCQHGFVSNGGLLNQTFAMATLRRMTEGNFEGVGGVRIFTRAWRPAGGAARRGGLVHGFNSHSGRYEWAAEQLVATAWPSTRSTSRPRPPVGRRALLRRRVRRLRRATSAPSSPSSKAREPGLPVFLLGHSAGGVIACLYALDIRPSSPGSICESFAYQVPAPDSRSRCSRASATSRRTRTCYKLKNEDFSRDPRSSRR